MRRMLPGLLQALRPASLGGPIAVCALAGWAIAPAPALADELSFALPIYNIRAAPHDAGAGAAERNVAPNLEAPEGVPQPRPALDLTRINSRFAVIELPREVSTPGPNTRPHHALGYRWRAAESWLHENGLDVQTCYLPMVRAHSKFGANGASGTLWLYGRCSFK